MSRVGSRRISKTVGVLVSTLLLFGCNAGAPKVVSKADETITSADGSFTAHLVPGPDQNGVATLVPRIQAASGQVVFEDQDAYSTRHRVGIVWQSDAPILWILSSDIGTARVREEKGQWVKAFTTEGLPEEIGKLR